MTAIDWSRWFSWKCSAEQLEKRREPFLNSESYAIELDDIAGRFYTITNDIPKYLGKSKPGDFAVSTRRRLWDAMNWLSLQYSAGADVVQIAEVWPHALSWAEEYAGFHEQYHQSPEAEGYVVPHAALRTEDYWILALRLVCFGLLTGHADQMPRVMRFLDYGNAQMQVYDGLLERLVAPFVPGRVEPPDTCTRHLPYRKLFKVFAAAPDQRPALMVKYLGEWYEASRREPYFERHLDGGYGFRGYWSWEAAATVWVLNIDDSSFRDMRFYPRDLVDFARSLDGNGGLSTSAGKRRPNVPASAPCPEAGWWFTPAQTGSRRYFKAGEKMPSVGGDYGLTFWQWATDQSAPKL